jgi:hypothetical protein
MVCLYLRGAKRYLLYFRQQAHTGSIHFSPGCKIDTEIFCKKSIKAGAGEIKAREVEREMLLSICILAPDRENAGCV